MSEDPKGFDAGDYNLYRYCNNDPMDLSDPMGMQLEGAWQPPKPTPFTSQILEGPGTVGAARPNREGTNRKLRIPDKLYGTAIQAAYKGADDAYDDVKSEPNHEMIGPIGQVDAARVGQYFPGPATRGIGVIKYGNPHAGDQGSDIKHLNDMLPRGSHLVGYYTVHIFYDSARLKNVDAPIFKSYWQFDPIIGMKSPGYNQDWNRPKYSSYAP